MGQTLKTEAIVLRKLRYGEADSILQLYTRQFGRVGVIAKGVRRSKSRFGGRLEPFFRLELVLHEGRGDLLTVTGASTIDPHAGLRTRAPSLELGAKLCDFVLRLLDVREQNLPAYNLLANALRLLDENPAAARRETGLAFRAKLMPAAGFSPVIDACVSCGAHEGLVAFSPATGGVVCEGCREAGDFAFGAEAHRLLSESLARPLAEAPDAEAEAQQQVDRAITETLAHHANVRIRGLA